MFNPLFLFSLLPAFPHGTLGQPDYMTIAEQAAAPLVFNAYNLSSGLWDTTYWWVSANVLTTLGDLAAINPNTRNSTSAIFSNTLGQAPHTHTKFLNRFYDDEAWWALAWINAFDVTKNPEYLQAAVDIFEDMTSGWGTPCGGMWWDKEHKGNFAIANELFLSVAAYLANRKPDRRDYYLDWAYKARDWFGKSGLINAQGVINDGIDLKTCKNNGDIVWSYNQGVILGAYVELAKLDSRASYLEDATSLAGAAIRNLSDSNLILHDVCEPTCDNTAAMFKGVFMRNLRILHRARPKAEFASFIIKNADSIWANNRIASGSEFHLGQVWSGSTVRSANATTQSAALDALVAAAAIAEPPSNASASPSSSSSPRQSASAQSSGRGVFMSAVLSVLLLTSLPNF